ncbi:uncharacterized protein LY89DRAFT_613222 [Mollisia scopiformis]|uniref:Xylanolytic transcriptional activator regulatory domain-containing protein n=1 Tax=Mollisia scopiformis TaxID=149040 RepID=A0A194XID2_MOLSC|nr:uncharacterized protein LY89DRAFT_613222 [Mollisia scopiformis]KUJ19527.1 hypothetical protein LY89DRAFT_613222 [Mollisia scopiformis]
MTVEVLFGRVAQLTELAIRHNLEIPPLAAEDQSLIDQVRENLPSSKFLFSAQTPSDPATWQNLDAPLEIDRAPDTTASQSQLPSAMMPIPNGSVRDVSMSCETGSNSTFDMQTWTDLSAPQMWAGSPSDWPWQVLNDFSAFPTFTASQLSPSFHVEAVSRNGEGVDASGSSDDEGEEAMIPHLAARFGSLHRAPDGRLRYYGTLSNHHFLKSFSQYWSRFEDRDPEKIASVALENARLDQEVPSSLKNHLIELFFEWHNPCHSAVDRPMFETARAHRSDFQSDFCSQSLIATICAIGAAFEGRYHQSFITFPKPLAEFFADKSKVLLELELDGPCVATVQALLLLSSHEAACGRETRQWLYSGQAMRLAFDLGLHVDSEPYVKQGLLSVREKEARHSTFWSCCVVNHLWSFSLGRPFRIDGEEITVPAPGGGSYDTGITYFQTAPEVPIPAEDNRQRPTDISILVAAQWVTLCSELAPLFRVLYGCVKISKASLQSLSAQTTVHFLRWKETIPDALQIKPDQAPSTHILLLHMAYHNFCILLHRPWTSKGSQPRGKIGPGYEHARRVCHNSASEIASLLRIYESHYGFRRMNVYAVNIIVSASLILIFGLIAGEVLGEQHDQSEEVNVASELNTCFRALDELGQSFEAARQHREHLLAIQKHWSQGRKEAKLGAKRRSRSQSSTSRASQRLSRRLRVS